jgi:hypothetical protein
MCKELTRSGRVCRASNIKNMTKCWSHIDTCSICLARPTSHDDISTLKCGHFFHAGCIYKWFDQDTTCPVCRDNPRRFIIYYDNDDDLPQESVLTNTISSLVRRRLIFDSVWVRRAHVLYNEHGTVVAAIEET